MGKASSAKKVARAARAGGSHKTGQRRPLAFPLAIGAVVLIGLVLVLFARDRRNADAFPRANQDHVHAAYDTYVCVPDAAPAPAAAPAPTTTAAPDPAAPSTTAAPDTTTTAPADTTTTTPTSTTVAAPGDVAGQFLPPFPDSTAPDTLGIHTHGDGLIHIHPFTDSVAGRKATLGVFLDRVGVSLTDDTMTLPDGTVYKEGTTKCQGGKDGQLQVAKWNSATDAAAGKKPNEIFTTGFDKIRLGANNAYTIAFMPAGSTIPAQSDVAQRIANVTDLGPQNDRTGSQRRACAAARLPERRDARRRVTGQRRARQHPGHRDERPCSQRTVRAVVLVGGFGTRLRPLTYHAPKQMLPVVNKPMIEWAIANVAAHGVDDVGALARLRRRTRSSRHIPTRRVPAFPCTMRSRTSRSTPRARSGSRRSTRASTNGSSSSTAT